MSEANLLLKRVPNINEAIQSAKATATWLAVQIDGLAANANLRNRVAGGCFSVSLDHQIAIALLLDAKVYSSAFALVRLQYDAFVRGLWLKGCATDDEVLSYSVDTEPVRMKKMDTLLDDVEACEAYAAGTMSAFKKENWSPMCSYTHTGGRQIQRYQTPSSVEQNYSAEEICEVAATSKAFALLAGMGIAVIANDERLAFRVLERARQL